jgi:anti-sigma B factor antagonist
MSAPDTQHCFEWEDAGGIAVVRFTIPYLRDERLIHALYDQIDQLINAGRTSVILNFTGVEAFASYAIGKLIRLNERLQPPAGRLVLCCLTEIVDEIIDIMNLRKRFQIYPTEQSALESFV